MALDINNNKQIPKPNWTDVAREIKRDIMYDINAVNIGIIQSFDPATQAATVQMALKRVVAVAPDGTRTLQERPLILEVPCFFPFGGGSVMSMPIQAGDNCIVLFNDREIDNWFVNGGVQSPTNYRSHSASDAFALVGIKNLQTAITDYIVNGCRLSYNANSRITLTEDLIESIAEIFKHNGTMHITQDLIVGGVWLGDSESGGNIDLQANVIQRSGYELHDGRKCNGIFERVTVVDGIVVSGS